ncbi:hypothetical protein EHS39_37070, partial [Ensifer sp. MPMI2T]
FRLAQDRKDLGFAKSARLHQNLLDHIAEKILLLNPVNAREDYPCADNTYLFPAIYSLKIKVDFLLARSSSLIYLSPKSLTH